MAPIINNISNISQSGYKLARLISKCKFYRLSSVFYTPLKPLSISHVCSLNLVLPGHRRHPIGCWN